METKLITHPGKMGDLLWAMATARALGGKTHVEIATSSYCLPLIPLLLKQSWIRRAYVLDRWKVRFEAPVQPAIPPEFSDTKSTYSEVFHLGMREWPTPNLPEYYKRLALEEYGITVDLTQPWLEIPGPLIMNWGQFRHVALSFSDEWVELKAGWINALCTAFPAEVFRLVLAPGSRLSREFRFPFKNLYMADCDIVGLAEGINLAKLTICCNSLAHPLAVGLGGRVLVAEPSTPRQQPVFKSNFPHVTYFDGINANELVGLVRTICP